MLSFASANLVIGVLSNLGGMTSVNYFCSGALIFTVGYFVYFKECSKMNPIDAESGGGTKVLSRTWDNKFDWFTLLFCIASACFYL